MVKLARSLQERWHKSLQKLPDGLLLFNMENENIDFQNRSMIRVLSEKGTFEYSDASNIESKLDDQSYEFVSGDNILDARIENVFMIDCKKLAMLKKDPEFNIL